MATYKYITFANFNELPTIDKFENIKFIGYDINTQSEFQTTFATIYNTITSKLYANQIQYDEGTSSYTTTVDNALDVLYENNTKIYANIDYLSSQIKSNPGSGEIFSGNASDVKCTYAYEDITYTTDVQSFINGIVDSVPKSLKKLADRTSIIDDETHSIILPIYKNINDTTPISGRYAKIKMVDNGNGLTIQFEEIK